MQEQGIVIGAYRRIFTSALIRRWREATMMEKYLGHTLVRSHVQVTDESLISYSGK